MGTTEIRSELFHRRVEKVRKPVLHRFKCVVHFHITITSCRGRRRYEGLGLIREIANVARNFAICTKTYTLNHSPKEDKTDSLPRYAIDTKTRFWTVAIPSPSPSF